MSDKIEGTYCFLIYSSALASDGNNSYEFGFGMSFFRLIGNKPFGRGDVVQITEIDQWLPNEFRIYVKVLGDPRVQGRYFDEKQRVELPTLLFLSSRIYLSDYSEYQIDSTINSRVLSFQAVRQDRNKIYSVAILAYGTEAKVICKDSRSQVKWEFVISDKPEQLERSA
jgi:hypothetical protein